MLRRVSLCALVLVSLLWIPSVSAQSPLGGMPLRIVLLVDSSGPVGTMLNPIRQGLLAFLDAVPADAEIAFISTGGQLRVRVPPTTDRERLKKSMQSFASDTGGNAFLDSLLEADKRFLKPAVDRKHVFVILTTDMSNTLNEQRIDDYNKFMQDYLQRRGKAHALIIRGVQGGVITDIANNFVKNTGGRVETLAAANAVPRLMKEVGELVAAQQEAR
jgi:hypothetical protein